MKLLVLGGTRFVGRAIVEAALARGHQVTLFNRGRSGPGVFAQLETLVGDRSEGLAAAAGRHWDAAIDTCGYVPRVVGLATAALRDRVAHYAFVSTISVYADMATHGANEDAARGTLEDPATEEVTGDTYGPLKALCEDVVRRDFEGRALIARPGLVAGPHDPTGRFTYWVERIAAGGEVLAPGPPTAPVQWIDVRDLAGWIVDGVARARVGTWHLTGPAAPLTFGRFLAECREALESDARFAWAPEAFLAAHQVAPWSELPLWVPANERGLLALDLGRALAAGLRHRPIAETVRDTLAWASAHPVGTSAASPRVPEGARVPGLNPLRESELLAALKAIPEGGTA